MKKDEKQMMIKIEKDNLYRRSCEFKICKSDICLFVSSRGSIAQPVGMNRSTFLYARLRSSKMGGGEKRREQKKNCANTAVEESKNR